MKAGTKVALVWRRQEVKGQKEIEKDMGEKGK